MNYSISTSRMFFGLCALSATALLVLPFMFPYQAQADILFRELSQGMSGADVSTLQTFLATDNTIYPQGLITGFFGPLTFSAVSNFQSRNGIATVGRVGPVTLTAINRLSGMGGSNDVNAPIISNAVASATASTATVSWATNGDTQGTVFYSSSPLSMTENTFNSPDTVAVSGLAVASANSGLRSMHSVQISNLQSNTLYYYVIHATDQAGNVSVTWPTTFRTNQ